MQVLERILAVDYNFPTSIPVSPECKDLLSRILVADPAKRYTIEAIQAHPWCVRAAPSWHHAWFSTEPQSGSPPCECHMGALVHAPV